MTVATVRPTVRPAAEEFAPFYAGYVAEAPEGDILATLERQGRETAALLRGVDEARALTRYAPGKWSIKEVIGHLADAERIFAYRALRIGRADQTPLASFEEDAYVAAAGFDARPLAELVAELEAVRAATVALFRGFDAAAWERRGTASGKTISVRALAWIVAGHERHHVRVLGERYGV